jgi:DNA helicase-2/ATP-dependent DNA helicase PcrA
MDFLLDDDASSPAQPAHRDPGFPPIDFRAALNDEQHAAVTADPGPVLVLAGAGSGKTRTLTYRVAYLLQELNVAPSEILLLTFTNKAAKEMLHRVQELTGIESFRFWGGTFHHIGHKVLRANSEVLGLDRSFTILDAEEAEHFLRDTVEEIDKGFFKNKEHPRPGVLFSMLSLARNTCTPLAETITRFYPQHEYLLEEIAPFPAAYRARKLKQQVTDYDDLLEFWLEILKKAPHVADYYRRRFRHVLVDEYQDTNIIQSQIVDLMSGNHQIMAVGDDAQSIYSWRGANVENILTFPDRHPGTAIHRIETNYRSSPEILALANGVIQAQPRGRGFDKELRAARPSHLKPYLVPAMDSREQASFIVQRLRGLRDSGYRLSDVAILYRAHFQALDIQLELTRLNVPYQITSGVRFFEQAHIRDYVAILRFLYNPADSMAFQRFAVLLPKVGDKGAQKLLALATEAAKTRNVKVVEALGHPDVVAKVPKDAKDEWPKLVLSLQDMYETMLKKKPCDVVEVGLDAWYGDYLKGAFANYDSRMDDLKSLIGFAARFDDMQELLAQIVLLTSETGDKKVESDEDTLRLTTVHQAKGLEYGIVFLIGLADGMFPLRRALESGDLEEERRLFYVAVTRAKDELYLCYPRMSSGKGGPITSLQPSTFVDELDDSLYEEVRLRRSWERSW